MAKIRLTKNELKKQKENLKRFVRYLPTLELKKKQLLQEINRIQREIDQLTQDSMRLEEELKVWVDVFSDHINLMEIIQIQDIVTEEGNIAGIDISVFKNVVFKEVEYTFFDMPLWVDTALGICHKQIARRIESEILEKQQNILREELRITIQRIKLFEEVKIPESRENIRVIQIFLGDLQTAEVVRGKIAKAKIERKKQNAGVL